jgi:hypothetical protein
MALRQEQRHAGAQARCGLIIMQGCGFFGCKIIARR